MIDSSARPASSTDTATTTGSNDPKNIVLISIDSLRADHCGFLGCDRELTPAMDRLAEQSVVFENAIAPGPRTPSSMPVAFTGHFPPPAELAAGQWGRRYDRISSHMRRHRTLPERLQAAGYTTVGVTVNPWTQKTAFDIGFDRFVEVTGDTVTSDGRWKAPGLWAMDKILSRVGKVKDTQWRLTRDWLVQWPHFYDTIHESLLDVPEPYFLWVFILDTHQPYLATRRYRRETSMPSMYYANFREMTGNQSEGDLSPYLQTLLKRSYRDAVRSTDAFVARLMTDLDDDPAIILHSDHGDALGEHGNWGHPETLYEENLHVPLLVYDGTTTSRVDDPVSLRSLPELASMLATDGTIDSDTISQDYVVAATEGIDGRALRGRRWKWIDDGDARALFDLVPDPEESTDLASEFPRLASDLQRLLERKWHHASEAVSIAEAVDAMRAQDASIATGGVE